MDENIRSEDIFEHIDVYQKPPLISLPEADDFRTLKYMGYTDSAIPILKFTLAITGFGSFREQLSVNLEDTLRKTNMRCAGLFSAIQSATLVLLDDTRPLKPIERAASLVIGAKNLYDDLWSGKFPQDMYKDHPLEMGQYPNLFSTSLVVEGPKARLYKSKNLSQITVLHGGRFYILETGLLGEDTGIEPLIETLNSLVDNAPKMPPKHSPGILTSADYSSTVRIFNNLRKNETNRKSLNSLRHSFITLCLDLENTPEDYTEAARIAHSSNWENRWHHASFQIVVFGNSKACVLCNFNAYLDGNTMMRSASEVQKRASAQDLVDHLELKSKHIIQVSELPWEISESALISAQQDIERVLDDQRATYGITTIGESSFTKLGLPPVQTFILALLLTTHRLTGNIANIYQMMTMSRFRCMDLTSAIVTTPECVEFVKYMEKNQIDLQGARELMEIANKSQINRARDARISMNYDKLLALFTLSKKGLRGKLTRLIMGFTVVFLRLLKLSIPASVDIIVSHPTIYPEVPVVGRPGIRLPYTRYFGLHYQIHLEKIVITMMPGLEWDVPNEKLIEELEHNLNRLLSLAIDQRQT